MGQYKNPPGNAADLERRINKLSTESDVPMQKIKLDIGNGVISQLLPNEVIIKGGSSMALRYPPSEIRLTSDFDIVYKNSLQDFINEFAHNLEKGWNDFSGKIIQYNSPTRTRLPEGQYMTPIDIRLSYRGKSFNTIRVEAVNQAFDEIDTAQYIISPFENKIFEDLNIPALKEQPVMSLENQLAQKFHGIMDEEKARPNDLIDVQIILNNDKDKIEINKFNEYLKRECKLIPRKYPLDLNQITQMNKQKYDESSINYPNMLPFEQALSIVEKMTNEAFG
jgi:hypothetical protein